MKDTTRAYIILAFILLFGSIANSAKAETKAETVHITPNLVLFEMNGVRILASCTTHNWAFPDKVGHIKSQESNQRPGDSLLDNDSTRETFVTDEIMWQAQPGSLMFGWINNACNEGVI